MCFQQLNYLRFGFILGSFILSLFVFNNLASFVLGSFSVRLAFLRQLLFVFNKIASFLPEK